MIHETGCPLNGTDAEHTDAAKRCSDEYRLHRLADPIGSIGHFIAIALADGSSDHVLYESRGDAVTHQHHNEEFYAYVHIGPHDMNACQAESFLMTNRAMYKAGIRLTDRDHPAGGRVMIPRLTTEDMQAQMRSILSGGIEPQKNIRLP
jgi:hypothetical protein